ncbi:MAG: TraR/DksA C4-type zinc finger protein [Deltaproteobacteria bacterium]|nr:TraR/DksA C4-type zinc finger protein [Deltaproteobacteria bacterium]
MLSERKKEELKEWLTQRLNEILGNAKGTLVDIGDFKDRLSDRMDQASLDSEMGLALRIRERETKLLRKIRDALGRLEDGTFGICENCGEEISVKRLMARPVTTLCIHCKKEQETAEKARATN